MLGTNNVIRWMNDFAVTSKNIYVSTLFAGSGHADSVYFYRDLYFDVGKNFRKVEFRLVPLS